MNAARQLSVYGRWQYTLSTLLRYLQARLQWGPAYQPEAEHAQMSHAWEAEAQLGEMQARREETIMLAARECDSDSE